MPAKLKEIVPQPNEVFLPSEEGEESADLVLESPSGSGKGKRTTEGYKLEILDWIDAWNAEKGRGGQSEASKKFKVSMLTLGNWRKKLRPKDGEEATPTPRKQKESSLPVSSNVKMDKVWINLVGKGFEVSKVTTYSKDGPVEKFHAGSLEKLNIEEYKGLDAITFGSTHVVSTSSSIVVAMTLEFLLDLLKLKP